MVLAQIFLHPFIMGLGPLVGAYDTPEAWFVSLSGFSGSLAKMKYTFTFVH